MIDFWAAVEPSAGNFSDLGTMGALITLLATAYIRDRRDRTRPNGGTSRMDTKNKLDALENSVDELHQSVHEIREALPRRWLRR